MKLLVTGGTGALGRHVVQRLRLCGHEVSVTVHPGDRAGMGWLASEGVAMLPCDIRDEATVRQAVHGRDAVVHLAGVAGVRTDDAVAMWSVNVRGARAVARACLAEGARLVHVSSCSAVGLGPDAVAVTEDTDFDRLCIRHAYPLSKRAGQRAVAAAVGDGLEATILCPGAVLAPGSPHANAWSSLPRVIAEGLAWAPPGGFGFVGRETFLRAVESSLVGETHPEPLLVIDDSASYRSVFDMVAQLVGRPATRTVSRPVVAGALSVAALARRIPAARRRVQVDRHLLPLLTWPNRYDGTRGHQKLRIAPRPLAEAVSDLVQPTTEGALR